MSVYFVPYLGSLRLHIRSKADVSGAGCGADGPHELFDTPFYSRFRAAMNWCVQHRWITIGLTVLSFALGIVGMGKAELQFFSDSSRPELIVDLWLPEGPTVQQISAETGDRPGQGARWASPARPSRRPYA